MLAERIDKKEPICNTKLVESNELFSPPVCSSVPLLDLLPYQYPPL